MNNITNLLISSWANRDGNVNKTKDILSWIDKLNKTTKVKVKETKISEDSFWFYDDYRGEILNRKRSFFSIVGMRYFVNNKLISEQPIIEQNEIGFLGIIVKEIDGVLNFLMQAKIEPGNVNCIQISPTIQATKSNFIRAHGGRLPHYFEWFENASNKGKIIYDQIQSEQGTRFDGKRNRNIILKIDKDTNIELFDNYKWMTLGQLKELSKINNLINMDTRTVLSGLPLILNNEDKLVECFKDKALYNSLFINDYSEMNKAYSLLNEYKMKNDVEKVIIPLSQLVDWKLDSKGIKGINKKDFEVKYYDIEIDGREVNDWIQPLFKANNKGLFVLFSKVVDGTRKYLISLRPEIGCFDKVEFGPTLQISNLDNNNEDKKLLDYFRNGKYKKLVDVVLSEEGGRFYHEQNRNVIIDVDNNIKKIPQDYLWVSYSTLLLLCQHNNCLNIQLRNLMSLMDL